MRLQSGDIIIYSDKFSPLRPLTWLTALIQLFTKTKANHAAVVVYNWGIPMLNEARGKGIICRPAENYLYRKHTSFVVLRARHQIDEAAFCIRANSFLGVRYDTIALFDQAIFRLTGKWVGKTSDNAQRRMICTAYAANCYRLERWWGYSCKEFLESEFFEIVEKFENIK